ncbi:MAG TPA: molybdopterin molybdotransferase MoeA, partial [Myxococcota bacterium]
VVTVDAVAVDDGSALVRRVVGRSLAGHATTQAIGVGEVVPITTGAALPPGTAAVIMREDTDEAALRDGIVTLRRRPKAGEHLRRRGDDVDVGAVVGEVGDVLTPARLNLLWSAGLTQAAVVRAPIVAILASGDELKQVGDVLGDDDVVNSNAWAIAAACRALGCEVRLLGIARDTLDDHARLLRHAIDDDRGAADVVISIGGVSMGSHDFVRPALEQIGATLSVFKLAMRPGKPLAFGFMPSSSSSSSSSPSSPSRALFFGLPGNPVSSLVTFELFVRPALRLLRGERRERVDVPRRRGVLGDATPFAKKKGLAFFARATTHQRADGVVVVTTLDRQGSGQISGLANADALCCFAADAERIAAGDEVEFIALG